VAVTQEDAMKTRTSLLAAAVAVVTALAPAASHAAVWTFTKSGAPWAAHAVTFAQPALDSLTFDVAASGAAPAAVTRMIFQVSGSVKSPEVANFQLVYYPGPGRSGVVVGTGSSPIGVTSSVLTIDLTTPVALQGDFAGTFALRLDVNGARAFFFQPQLQTVTIDEGGVIRNVMETGDLPMPGDSFYVN
jgi:hypothetical protein